MSARSSKPKIILTQNDLPASFKPGKSIAVDTETMGLRPLTDKLCLVQISNGDGVCHLVQLKGKDYKAPRLKKILEDPKILKIFHFARADMGFLTHYLKCRVRNVYCTRIASYLTRTNTDQHSLRVLCKEFLGVEISKEEQTSDWSAPKLTDKQLSYAASDVLYLHQLRVLLEQRLKRDGRQKPAQSCFDFLETRVQLDLGGFADRDLFAH